LQGISWRMAWPTRPWRNKAVVALGATVRRQALVLGFSDTFAVIGIALAIAALMVCPAQKATVGGDNGGTH
jgi:DHA2 family multidrug resistance protein